MFKTLNLYKQLYLNIRGDDYNDTKKTIEPIQAVVFKWSISTFIGICTLIEPIQAVVFKCV